ncbi:ROK family protein [Alloscardovia theropitheci]|uniref:ROK family protein n=1 Tax=Alloscardovia theropitheci TaxID=2496842 RepID=A0A4R0QX54_9BIFI|nr:ROK family protein [Alloscardovia theropitheci]TCD53961.1 ROK family protein [Alloscardovia theropitheci]
MSNSQKNTTTHNMHHSVKADTSSLFNEESAGFATPFGTNSIKADPTDVRINNRIAVFDLLFPRQSLSRAQVSRRVGLSRASVSDVVASMIDEHILTESDHNVEAVPGKRGKRGTLLEIDTDYWNIVALDLSQEFLIQAIVTNLSGQILSRIEVSVSQPSDITLDIVKNICERIISQAPGHVIGIGIAVPGIVDEQGTVIDSRNLNWSNVPLAQFIKQEFDMTCIVENDANCALLAERFFGSGDANLIVIQISVGVGAAVMINGTLVSGTNNAAGEIGHCVIDTDGQLCICGKRGCVETTLSVPALHKQFAQLEPQNFDGRLEIITRAGKKLGQVLSMPISLLDINEIAIYGPADIVNETLLQSVSEVINEQTKSAVQPRHVQVKRCDFGENIVMLGATISVLQHVLRTL